MKWSVAHFLLHLFCQCKPPKMVTYIKQDNRRRNNLTAMQKTKMKRKKMI